MWSLVLLVLAGVTGAVVTEEDAATKEALCAGAPYAVEAPLTPALMEAYQALAKTDAVPEPADVNKFCAPPEAVPAL